MPGETRINKGFPLFWKPKKSTDPMISHQTDASVRNQGLGGWTQLKYRLR